MSRSHTVLVTGVGGGLGALMVESLLTAGHTVIGSMRDIGNRNRGATERLSALGALVVEIDVTDDASTERGVQEVTAKAGPIDVLVNNAGLGALGLAEAFTPTDFKRVFDVNVFGVQRMNRAVMPTMKERGSGLLITITSLTGRLSLPFQGPYSCSKWAAEALAELYRVEGSQLGIESCIVEPGGLPTEFIDKLSQPSDSARADTYGVIAALPAGFLKIFRDVFAANPTQDPQLVADAVLRLVETPHGERPFRTIVDHMGLGDQVAPYNDHLEKMMDEVYTTFGIPELLHTKTQTEIGLAANIS